MNLNVSKETRRLYPLCNLLFSTRNDEWSARKWREGLLIGFYRVSGGEAPKVKDCPNDIEVTGRNGTAITWTEPIFTDNVKVTRIRSNEVSVNYKALNFLTTFDHTAIYCRMCVTFVITLMPAGE